MATKADAPSVTPVETTTTPTLYVVTEAFVTQVDGALGVYKKGKVVPAGDPYLKAMPGRFAPFDPLNPPRRRGGLTIPEVRS